MASQNVWNLKYVVGNPKMFTRVTGDSGNPLKRAEALAGAATISGNGGWRVWVEHAVTGKRIFESEAEKAFSGTAAKSNSATDSGTPVPNPAFTEMLAFHKSHSIVHEGKWASEQFHQRAAAELERMRAVIDAQAAFIKEFVDACETGSPTALIGKIGELATQAKDLRPLLLALQSESAIKGAVGGEAGGATQKHTSQAAPL